MSSFNSNSSTKRPIAPALFAEPDVKLRKITQKTRLRLQIVARLSLKNIPDTEIALQLGYSDATMIRNLRATPEYKAIFYGLANNIVTEMDASFAANAKDVQAEVRSRIPDALKVLYEALEDRKVENRLKAAEKIIAIDGRFDRKGDQTSTVNQFFLADNDTNAADEIASAINAAGSGSRAAKK
jgi:hypothetical protein